MNRKESILNILSTGTQSITELDQKLAITISKATLKRDLLELAEEKLIVKQEQGRNTKYKLSANYSLIQKIDLEKYFQENLYSRKIQETFNEDILDILKENKNQLFSNKESEQIQKLNNSFKNGNKRTSRMLANGILISSGFCPLSFGSINELDYKKAVLVFYEQNNISSLKSLLIEQFEFAVNSYFQVHEEAL